MPYKTRTSNGKVTVSKASGGHQKVVGHTTPQKKKAYLAALHIHSKDKDKTKKENLEGAVTEMYAIKNPYSGCQAKELVIPFDPVSGISQDSTAPEDIRGVYYDRQMADTIAEKLYEDHIQYEIMLEKKKKQVIKELVNKIKKLEEERKGCINELESQRENKIKNLGKSPEEIEKQIGDLETVKNRDMRRVRANPYPSTFHKERISKLTVQIDDLMATLEHIQNALKGIEDEEVKAKKGKR